MFNLDALVKAAREEVANHREKVDVLKVNAREEIKSLLERKKTAFTERIRTKIKALIQDKESNSNEISIRIYYGDCNSARSLNAIDFEDVFKDEFENSEIGKALQAEGWLIPRAMRDDAFAFIICTAQLDLYKKIMEARASWQS
jgi:hypothetical protein